MKSVSYLVGYKKPFVWAFALSVFLSLGNCAPQSGIKSLTYIESQCVQYTDSELSQRFLRAGFNLDQYLSEEIKQNPAYYQIAKDAFGALSVESLQAFVRLDQHIRRNPVMTNVLDANGNVVGTDGATEFLISIGHIDQPANTDPSVRSYTTAVTSLSSTAVETISLPYKMTIANNTASIDPSVTIEYSMHSTLHELGHVLTEFWQFENQRTIFGDAPGTFDRFKDTYNGSPELRQVVTGHTASSEYELMANGFHALHCSPDSYVAGMEHIPEAMQMLRRNLPEPQWRSRATQLAKSGIRVESNQEALWVAGSADTQKIKICEGNEAQCLSGGAKIHSLARPSLGNAWGIRAASLGVGANAQQVAQKVITIFAQDDRGDDYFYTIALEI